MCKDTINQRFILSVNYIISEKIAPTKASIAQQLEIKSSKFSEILNQRMGVSAELLSIFCKKYGISVEWILTGDGSMIKKPENSITQQVSEPKHEYNKVNSCELCKEKDERIKDLQKMVKFQNDTINSILQQIEPIHKQDSDLDDTIGTKTG